MPAKVQQQLSFDRPKKLTKRQQSAISHLRTDSLPRYAWPGVISVDIAWMQEQHFDEGTLAFLGMMQIRHWPRINRCGYEECDETCRIFGLPDHKTYYAEKSAGRK